MYNCTVKLTVLNFGLAVCKLENNDQLIEMSATDFFSITKTSEELSLVCKESDIPENCTPDGSWSGLKVQGPLDFSLTGILSSLAGPLADAGISIFTISTYDTDYLLVKTIDLDKAISVLRAKGHEIDT